MNELYLGHTMWEYLFMTLWMMFTVGVVYCYVRICDLEEQVEYYKSLNCMMIGQDPWTR